MNYEPKLILSCIGMLGFFLILAFGILSRVSLKPFILRRYEEETNLAATEQFFFNNWLMGVKQYRVLFYSAHLMIVTMLNEKLLKKSPAFKNSPSREEILSHFSKKERTLTIITWASFFVGIFLLFGSYLPLRYFEK